MRQGKTATVKRGPYAGDQLTVDHIIPRSVAPELDNVIGDFELMPPRMNASKGDRIGERQVSPTRALHKAGLPDAERFWAVNGEGRFDAPEQGSLNGKKWNILKPWKSRECRTWARCKGNAGFAA